MTAGMALYYTYTRERETVENDVISWSGKGKDRISFSLSLSCLTSRKMKTMFMKNDISTSEIVSKS